MALTTIEYGSLASSATLNNNFNYLDGRITTTATSVSTLSSQISTINTNLTNNKANTDLSNVTDTVLTGKLSSTVLTNAGCLTSANISSASNTVKSTVTAWSMPDYSAGISVSDNWTATADGWLRCQCDFAGWGTYVTLDGVKVSGVACLWTGDSSHWQSYNLIPVNAGQVVKFNGQSGYMEVQFYPMKGAN